MQASAQGVPFFRFLAFGGNKFGLFCMNWVVDPSDSIMFWPSITQGSVSKALYWKVFGFKCPAMKWALRSVRLSWWSSVLGMGSSVPAVGLSCRSHIHIPNSMWDQRKSSSSWAFSFGWMVHEILSWIPHCNKYRKVAVGQLIRLP